MVVTFFYATNNGLKYDKKFGLVLGAIYCVFQVIATGVEVKHDYF